MYNYQQKSSTIAPDTECKRSLELTENRQKMVKIIGLNIGYKTTNYTTFHNKIDCRAKL
jgi:hypothetical protein